MITIIFAHDKNYLIGNSDTKNGLPWHYPEDLRYYRKQTINKVNVMGRRTYEAIQRALPDRETIVLSKNADYSLPDAKVTSDSQSLIENYQNSDEELMVVGGFQVFQIFWKYANKILITKIEKEYQGDRYFKNYDLSDFELVETMTLVQNEVFVETWQRKK